MPIAAPVAAGIGAATSIASVGVGIAGAAAGGGGGQPQGQLKLPPEMEIDFLNRSQESLQQISQDLDRATSLEKTFNDKLTTLEGMIQGTIPEADGIKSLQQSTLDMAKAFGGDTQALIESGFLTPEVAQELSDLRALESEDLQDPNLENQINEERKKLEQDLARGGVGPAQRAQALRQFERSADEQRFTRAEELRTGKTERGLQRIGAGLEARQSGFGQALQGFDVGSSALEQLFGQRAEGIQGLGSIAGSRFQAGQDTLGVRSGLRGEERSIFEQAGRIDFSKHAKQALESGLSGPGSIFGQTGIARDDLDIHKDQVKRKEEAASAKRLGLTPNQAEMERIKRVMNRGGAGGTFSRAGVGSNFTR